MDLKKFNEALKEQYVNPMNEFYRNRYREIFKEEPPDNPVIMMDRMLAHGNEQIKQIKGERQ